MPLPSPLKSGHNRGGRLCNPPLVIQLQWSISLRCGCILDDDMSGLEYVGALLQNVVPRWGTLADYTIDPFTPDDPYVGPLKGDDKPCTCNTVTWPLFAACAICQNGSPISHATSPCMIWLHSLNPLTGAQMEPMVNHRSNLYVSRYLTPLRELGNDPIPCLASFPNDIPPETPTPDWA